MLIECMWLHYAVPCGYDVLACRAILLVPADKLPLAPAAYRGQKSADDPIVDTADGCHDIQHSLNGRFLGAGLCLEL